MVPSSLRTRDFVLRVASPSRMEDGFSSQWLIQAEKVGEVYNLIQWIKILIFAFSQDENIKQHPLDGTGLTCSRESGEGSKSIARRWIVLRSTPFRKDFGNNISRFLSNGWTRNYQTHVDESSLSMSIDCMNLFSAFLAAQVDEGLESTKPFRDTLQFLRIMKPVQRHKLKKVKPMPNLPLLLPLILALIRHWRC